MVRCIMLISKDAAQPYYQLDYVLWEYIYRIDKSVFVIGDSGVGECDFLI